MYSKERVVSRFEAGELVLGTSAHTASPELLELYALCGFDFVFFDMMFTAIDWTGAQNLIAAGRAAGITAIPRVPAFPWIDDANEAGPDRAMLSNISRALGIGAGMVMYAPSNLEDVRLASRMVGEYRRKTHLLPQKVGGRPIVSPLIESAGLYERLDDVFKVEGLEALWLGLPDLSKILLGRVDVSAPEMLKLIDRAVDLGKRHGVKVGASTGYHGEGPQGTAVRVNALSDRGVAMVLVSGATSMLQTALAELMNGVKRQNRG